MSTIKRNNMFKATIDNIKIREGFNVREDYGDIEQLANSIEQHGIRVPLSCHKEKGMFIPSDGHRRIKALQLLQSQGKCLDLEIPICVQPKEYTDKDRHVDMLICNSGKNLSLLEEARLYERLRDDYECTNTEIAKMVSKSSAHIGNALLLLDAPQGLLDYIQNQQVSASTIIDQLKLDGDGNVTLGKVQQAIEANDGKRVTKKNLKEFEDPEEKSFSDKLAEAQEYGHSTDNTIYQPTQEDPTEQDNFQDKVRLVPMVEVLDSEDAPIQISQMAKDETLTGLNLAISELISNEDLVSKAAVKTMEFVESLLTGDITPTQFVNHIQNDLV